MSIIEIAISILSGVVILASTLMYLVTTLKSRSIPIPMPTVYKRMREGMMYRKRRAEEFGKFVSHEAIANILRARMKNKDREKQTEAVASIVSAYSQVPLTDILKRSSERYHIYRVLSKSIPPTYRKSDYV